jgi:hypothetical protein
VNPKSMLQETEMVKRVKKTNFLTSKDFDNRYRITEFREAIVKQHLEKQFILYERKLLKNSFEDV